MGKTFSRGYVKITWKIYWLMVYYAFILTWIKNTFYSNEEYASECQACEENVEIKIASTKKKSDCLKESPETNLINRFVSQKQKSNLSRAPPLN